MFTHMYESIFKATCLNLLQIKTIKCFKHEQQTSKKSAERFVSQNHANEKIVAFLQVQS